MSRNELLDASNEALLAARRSSMRALAGVIDERSGAGGPVERIAPAVAIEMTAAWAYVHGLAMLLIDGRLNSIAAITDDVDDAAALVDATLERMRLRDEGDAG